MAIFRVEKTSDYTVMSNYHLKDKKISLKAKGLLSQMLSLPEDWDYTLSGLCYLNKESKDAIRSAITELEQAGYIRRRQTTDAAGRFGSNEYIIYEKPIQEPMQGSPSSEKPSSGNPTTDKPTTGKPLTENPTQLNIDKQNTNQSNTKSSNTHSIPSRQEAERRRREGNRDAEQYRNFILENIEYEYLQYDYKDCEELEEIVELMIETVCAKRSITRIGGSEFPHDIVKSRFLKLTGEHIRFVLDCMKKNTTEIRNMKQYLLTVLFNAPTTMRNSYAAQVNHDLYADSL